MSRSMTPLDRQNYRESKRRRRQAIIEEETGRILPPQNARRRVAAIITAVFIAAAVFCGVILYNNLSVQRNREGLQSAQSSENENLLEVVNEENPLSSDYVPPLSDFGSFKVGSCVYNELTEFLKHAEEQGVSLKITSAYVSYEEQNRLYEAKLDELLSTGSYTAVRAEAAAKRAVPKAGCSEAQTGLLVSFNTDDSGIRNFVEKNCISYGFILRYPEDKEDITKMNSSTACYRYVGKDNAIKLRSYGMCLEEYNIYLSKQGFGE